MIIDPKGPEEGCHRVSRSGDWSDSGWSCRSAYRSGYSPGYRISGMGFRVALVDPVGPAEDRNRVFRGGGWNGNSWTFDGSFCRSAVRDKSNPGDWFNDLGFRVTVQATEGVMLDTDDPVVTALRTDPADTVGWLAWADRLEEEGQIDRAEFLRAVTWLRLTPEAEDRDEVQSWVQGLLATSFMPPTITHTNSIGMKFTVIPPGLFWMGSPDTEQERHQDEGPRHLVAINSFLLGTFPVTQEQYERVMGTNSSSFKDAPDAPRHPVVNVSWHDAVEFCQKLSELDKRTYQLPTEAQWEYACRAGTTTPFAFGDSLSSTQANFNGNYPYGGAPKGPNLARTCAVGSYKPNAFGLHDMHGNVWEWCNDWYSADTYPERAKEIKRLEAEELAARETKETFIASDPTGPEEGRYRVLRGGSWLNDGWLCRSALRYRIDPGNRSLHLGFRVALVDPTGPEEGRYRAYRGGNWYNYGRYCRSAFRSRNDPGNRGDLLGFRVAFVDPVGQEGSRYQNVRGGCWISRSDSCRSATLGGCVPTFRERYLGFRLLMTQGVAS